MFRKLSVRFAGIALLALAMSCGDDGNNPNFKLTATVDGASFNATAVTANTDSTYLTISGASNTQVITLHITVPSAPGTLALHDTSTTDYAIITEGGRTWSSTFGGSGTVTFVTTNGSEASGTFNFIAPPEAGSGTTTTRTVTNGTFKAHF